MTEQVEKNNSEVVSTQTVSGESRTGGRTPFVRGNNRGGGAKGPFKKNIRSKRKPFEKIKPEFDQKIIDIRRVTRVVKGGRRFSFSVVMVLGNKKGSVGVGIGKATDTSLAIEKAIRNAKKNMLRLKLTKTMSIPHDSESKYCSSKVILRPAKGKGVVAGSSVRTVLEMAGITETGAKLLTRSKNKLNNAMAALNALSVFKA